MTLPDFTHDRAGTAPEEWRAHPSWPEPHAPERVLEGVRRLVVVAAHPDDETLGAGALVAAAAAAGLVVDLIVLTDGEASHPHSPSVMPAAMAARRRQESRAAALALGVASRVWSVGLPDGGLDQRVEEITVVLVEALGDARDTLLLAPWRHDGHRDHEAAGRAAAAAARRTGARLWEYPIWFWRWGDPGSAPWSLVRAVAAEGDAGERKRLALDEHRSQVAPLSAAPGDEVLLGEDFLAHFLGDREVFIAQAPTDLALDELHALGADPWAVESSWYERRKRDLTLASLPRERFRRGLEVGCSRGALAADLAARCDVLVAIDQSPEALDTARAVVPGNVELRHLDAPSEWPEGEFDLVVLSEVGYFLSPAALEELLDRVRSCLAADGVVVLCHWQHAVVGWVLDGPDVHERALRADLPPLASRYVDRDVELLVLARDADRPVAG